VFSPKLFRLLFAATVVAGVSAPMFGAYAATTGQNRSVDTYNMPRGFEVPGAKNPYQPLEININDTVKWNILEGEHTVTPKNGKQWGDSGSDHLTDQSPVYSRKFTTAGDYIYYCSIHGGLDENGDPTGMWGKVHVIDPTPTTQPPATQPPATTSTTQPDTTSTTRQLGSTPPATTATAPTTRSGPTAPAPTTTTAKGEKDKKPKEETTTTSSTLPPPIDLPDSAIIPTLPGASTTSSADPGAPADAPANTPEGEAVALLKGKKSNGDGALKLLIVSGLGLGALGVGSAGYKYHNRSSKYFPA